MTWTISRDMGRRSDDGRFTVEPIMEDGKKGSRGWRLKDWESRRYLESWTGTNKKMRERGLQLLLDDVEWIQTRKPGEWMPGYDIRVSEQQPSEDDWFVLHPVK